MRATTLCVALSVAACHGNIGAELVTPPAPRVTPAPSATPTASPTPSPTTPPVDPPKPFEPGPPVVRRVVGAHYVATIGTLLGPEAAALAIAPPDAALNGLDAIGAAQLALDTSAVRAYESSARAVAAAAIAHGALARWAQCRSMDDACYGTFVSRFARALFRRPLEADEITAWVAVAHDARVATMDFDTGLLHLIAGLLQAPSFLYRPELGADDPAHPGWKKLTPHELATRLAFFLTERGPDDALLTAADRGELETPAAIATHVDRLLATPEAQGALASYYDELLQLRDLPTASKNAALFPELDDALRNSMREETQRFIADIVWTENTDFRRIFDANYTFMDTRLATLYGVDRGLGRGFTKVTLPPATKRGGIFGQASFHTLHSHATTTSPTLRGKFVREVLMCQPIRPPPPGVVTVLPVDPPNTPRTTRQRLEDAHFTNEGCRGCHANMDGIGFGLENFDPIGKFRLTENNLPIDARTALDGAAFEGAAELGALIAPMRGTMVCAARGLYRQAVGRVETENEEAAITAIVGGFEASGWRMQKLLAEIVLSDGFRYVKAE